MSAFRGDSPRIFDLSHKNPYGHHGTPVLDIRSYDFTTGLSHPHFSADKASRSLRVDRDVIIIAVDGACRGEGTATAVAAYGVFFGPGSPYNSHGFLPRTASHTAESAEIFAVSKALESAERIVLEEPNIDSILIITDSGYVTWSMSEEIYTWIQNGFIHDDCDVDEEEGRVSGPEVENREALLALHEAIKTMENDGIQVRFWPVEGPDNQDAARLVNQALISAAPIP